MSVCNRRLHRENRKRWGSSFVFTARCRNNQRPGLMNEGGASSKPLPTTQTAPNSSHSSSFRQTVAFITTKKITEGRKPPVRARPAFSSFPEEPSRTHSQEQGFPCEVWKAPGRRSVFKDPQTRLWSNLKYFSSLLCNVLTAKLKLGERGRPESGVSGPLALGSVLHLRQSFRVGGLASWLIRGPR